MRVWPALRGLGLVGGLAVAAGCDTPIVQPVAFNHELHTTKAELECDSCHEHPYDAPHAGLPALKVCMGCHKTVTPASEYGAAVIGRMREMADAGGQLAWQRVYRLAPHVYFSHRRHVELAELECTACHGDMAKLSAPPERPIAETLDMDHCIACHEARKVTKDCAACHR